MGARIPLLPTREIAAVADGNEQSGTPGRIPACFFGGRDPFTAFRDDVLRSLIGRGKDQGILRNEVDDWKGGWAAQGLTYRSGPASAEN